MNFPLEITALASAVVVVTADGQTRDVGMGVLAVAVMALLIRYLRTDFHAPRPGGQKYE